MSIASQYIKPSLADYVQLALEKNVMRIVQAPELDLCTDPVEVGRYSTILRAPLFEVVADVVYSCIIGRSMPKRLRLVYPLPVRGTSMRIKFYRRTFMLEPSTFSVSPHVCSRKRQCLTSVDLQELRFLCVETIRGLVKSTVQLPYTIKMMARETLLALRVGYPKHAMVFRQLMG